MASYPNNNYRFESYRYGLIGTRNDVDTFKIYTNGDFEIGVDGLGAKITLDNDVRSKMANLDVKASLYRQSDGVLVAEYDPQSVVDVEIKESTGDLPASYYLEITGTGKEGDDGYSDYGSLGFYVLTHEREQNTTFPFANNYQNHDEGDGDDFYFFADST